MHIVYGMIETLRKENAEIKEVRLLVEKVSAITSALVDRKLEVNLHPMKNVSTDTDRRMLPDQEVTVTKEKANEKVSWNKKVKNSKEEGSKIVTLQSAIGSTEKKRESIETSRASKNFTKPTTFDGTTSWIDYRSQFEMCAELNNWTNQQKGLYLGVSLRGLAQGVLRNLSVEDQKSFEALSKALSERF